MQSILIVGFREKEAGKTMLAQALLQYLRENGINAYGFKPKAGNCLWYDYDTVHEALSQGRLYGKDAKLLKYASETNLLEEVINPIHRLWVEDFVWKPLGKLPNFLVDRITLFKGNLRILLVINKRIFNEYYQTYKEGFEALLSKSNNIYEVQDVNELNKVIEEYYDKAISLAYEKIKENSELIIVESYSDVALPYDKLENIKIVFGIKPWRIKIYEPDRYLEALKLLSQFSYKEITTEQVSRLLKPKKEIRILPTLNKEIVRYLKNELKRLSRDILIT